MPASLAMAAISGIGSIVPTSLFACITVIRIVFGVRALRTSSGSTIPYRSTGSMVTFAPSFSRNRQGLSVAGCSTAVVMMWSPRSRLAKKTPLMAWLFDSLPPLVKTTSVGSHPRSPATCPRAFSTASFAGIPAQWRLDGFP